MELESANLKQTQKNESMKILSFVFLFIALVTADQLTKYFAQKTFLNYQFAFSLPLPVWVIYSVYAAVLAAMIIYCKNNYRNFINSQVIAWILIFAGSVSNIGERVILGYVKDWIYILTGVFNLADAYIIAGILLFLFQSKITNLQSKINL